MDGATAEQMEFLAGFPRVKRFAMLRDLAEVLDREGPVLPQHLCAKLLGVSNQRIGQFIDEGRLGSVRFHGLRYVPYEALRYFCAEERKNGRPHELAEVAINAPLPRLAERVHKNS